MKKKCRKSGKVKFDSHDSAMKRADEILAKPNCHITTRSLSAYQCPHCSKYHLTSNKPRVPANGVHA